MIKEKNNKLFKSIIVCLLLITLLCIFGYNNLSYSNIPKYDEKNFDDFFKNNIQEINIADSKIMSNININKDENSIASIEIPKIDLKTIMYDINSKNNTVDKHIQILKGSTMPDIEKGNFILASHSGTSQISYFKNLHKLKENDVVYINYKDKKYTYIIYDMYKLNKDGTIEIKRDKNKTMLTLTTCDTTDDTKQLVVLANMISATDIK